MEDEKDVTPPFGTEIIPEPIKENVSPQLMSRLRLFNWKKGYIRLAAVLSVIWFLLILVGLGMDYSFTHDPFLELLFKPVGIGLFFLWVVVPFLLWAVAPFLVYVTEWVISGFTDTDKD
jgi:ACR3 family arsenite efflux pump ArsB